MPTPESRASIQATPPDPTTVVRDCECTPVAVGSAQSVWSVPIAPLAKRSVAAAESTSPSPATPVRLASP
jgi:hypothetical protein